LSGLVLLRDHLTPDNHSELLSASSGKSKTEIQALLAQRPLELETDATRKPAKNRLEPLSVARYKVQFTASQELKDKLERATNLLSGQIELLKATTRRSALARRSSDPRHSIGSWGSRQSRRNSCIAR
jgi:hypothetical protein